MYNFFAFVIQGHLGSFLRRGCPKLIKPREVLLKGFGRQAQPLYDQKVFKTERLTYLLKFWYHVGKVKILISLPPAGGKRV